MGNLIVLLRLKMKELWLLQRPLAIVMMRLGDGLLSPRV